jgi:hypothetical protein
MPTVDDTALRHAAADLIAAASIGPDGATTLVVFDDGQEFPAPQSSRP